MTEQRLAVEQNEIRDVLDTDNSVLFRKSYSAAIKHGNKTMSADLKQAGFKTAIFISDSQINGSKYYRINYSK